MEVISYIINAHKRKIFRPELVLCFDLPLSSNSIILQEVLRCQTCITMLPVKLSKLITSYPLSGQQIYHQSA